MADLSNPGLSSPASDNCFRHPHPVGASFRRQRMDDATATLGGFQLQVNDGIAFAKY